MKIALAQLNPIVGDLAGNTELILAAASEARAAGADILLTPELALTGYPPEDLLLRPAFLAECRKMIGRFIDEVDGITLVVGHPFGDSVERFNCATVIRDGHILGRYEKMLLPNDTVFDEVRYFTPGCSPLVFEQDGIKVGVLICEDLWEVDPASAAADEGAQVVERDVAGARQGQRDADHEQREQGVERRRDKPTGGIAQGVGMLGEVAVHGVMRRAGGRVQGAGRAARGGPSTADREWR